MSRLGLRLVLIPVVLLIGYGTFYMNRSKAGVEHRKAAHEMIRQVEGYAGKAEYYDWLVDDAHDHVFNESYHSELVGRRRTRTWIDEGQYSDDLFEWMIRQAKDDKAYPVAAALEKFRAEHSGAAPAPAGSGPSGATGKPPPVKATGGRR